MTLTGGEVRATEFEFIFFARQVIDLRDSNRRFSLTAEDIRLVNPNTGTAPIFRTKSDAELTVAIYRRVQVLVRENETDGNPWGISFQQGHFNMTSDSHRFRSAAQLESDGCQLNGNKWSRVDEEWLPLYEGKMIHIGDHRFGTYKGQTQAQANQGTLPTPTDIEHNDPDYEVLPRYWISAVERDQKSHEPDRGFDLSFRDITSATSERTMIPTVIGRVATGNKLPLIYFDESLPWPSLIAALQSLVVDFVARQKVGGTNMTFFYVKQLAVPAPSRFLEKCPWSDGSYNDWFVPRLLELSFTSWGLRDFAAAVGWDGPPFEWNRQRRQEISAELNAAMFAIFGCSQDEVSQIMNSFNLIRDQETKEHGEFLSLRLILECFGRMKSASETQQYLTNLQPVAGDIRAAHT